VESKSEGLFRWQLEKTFCGVKPEACVGKRPPATFRTCALERPLVPHEEALRESLGARLDEVSRSGMVATRRSCRSRRGRLMTGPASHESARLSASNPQVRDAIARESSRGISSKTPARNH